MRSHSELLDVGAMTIVGLQSQAYKPVRMPAVSRTGMRLKRNADKVGGGLVQMLGDLPSSGGLSWLMSQPGIERLFIPLVNQKCRDWFSIICFFLSLRSGRGKINVELMPEIENVW